MPRIVSRDRRVGLEITPVASGPTLNSYEVTLDEQSVVLFHKLYRRSTYAGHCEEVRLAKALAYAERIVGLRVPINISLSGDPAYDEHAWIVVDTGWARLQMFGQTVTHRQNPSTSSVILDFDLRKTARTVPWRGAENRLATRLVCDPGEVRLFGIELYNALRAAWAERQRLGRPSPQDSYIFDNHMTSDN